MRVLLDVQRSQQSISGMTKITWAGTVELMGGFETPTVLSVRASGVSKDTARAKQTALADLHTAGASAVIRAFEEQIP